MKILNIVPSYVPAYRYGGTIECVHDLNKALVKNGVDVTVYTTNADGPNNLNVPLGKEVDIDGVRVIYFPLGVFRGWFYSAQMRKALKENIRDFDLIHIVSVFLSASALGAHYAKRAGRPYIISPHGSLMEAPLKKGAFKKALYVNLIEKLNLKGASAIHFTVEKEKEEYLSAGLPLKRAIISPNGLDMEKFPDDYPRGEFRRKYKISADKKIVLFLSRISWKKGFDVLIPAFAEVAKKENTVLVVAGGDDEDYKKNVQELISNFHLADSVVFTGMIGGGERLSAYRDADVFVLPSYSENFGMVVLEALAMELPVVISPEVGVSPFLIAAKAGVVAERTPQKFAEAILGILGNEVEREELKKNGLALVRNGFSWKNIAEDFAKEYNSIING